MSVFRAEKGRSFKKPSITSSPPLAAAPATPGSQESLAVSAKTCFYNIFLPQKFTICTSFFSQLRPGWGSRCAPPARGDLEGTKRRRILPKDWGKTGLKLSNVGTLISSLCHVKGAVTCEGSAGSVRRWQATSPREKTRRTEVFFLQATSTFSKKYKFCK